MWISLAVCLIDFTGEKNNSDIQMNRLDDWFQWSYHTAYGHALALESKASLNMRRFTLKKKPTWLDFSTITLERMGEMVEKERDKAYGRWALLFVLCGFCCDSWAGPQSRDWSISLFISLWLIDTYCLCSVVSLMSLISPGCFFSLFWELSIQETIVVWECG